MKRWVGVLALLALACAAGAVAETRTAQEASVPGASAAGRAAQTASALTKETSPWWAHIAVLASSDMQGRLTGSAGYQKAADYVAGRFREYGLKPGGTDGYFQPVDFEVQVVDQARSSVVLTPPTGAPVTGADLMIMSPGVQQPADLKAQMVFVGYGVHLPQAGHDDFAGLDLRGKVAVLIRGGPDELSGRLKAFASAEELAPLLEARGAVGLISISTPGRQEAPWTRSMTAGAQPGLYLSDPSLRRFHGAFFSAQMNPDRAELLFSGSERTFAELAALAETGQPLPVVTLKTGLEAHVAVTTGKVTSPNVVGVLPGSDPTLAPEAVVLSAHLDHLGTGAPDNGADGIFHGAMDNASGVASLLEIARQLQRQHARPRRSIIFLVVCGEEKGLLGSRYFVGRPSVFAGHIVADINIDMFLPIVPLTRLVAYGDAESSLGDLARAVAAEHGIQIVADPAPARFIFIRSDQYAFIRTGVPALMFEFAAAPGSPEERTLTDWRFLRYHAQQDDLFQPVDLAAAEAFDRFVQDVLLRISDAPAPPVWLEGSLYKGR
ncbi:MAG: family peptidase [Caulobacter sp.]|nr:family peptidase [Caulobacter sp.]